MSDAAFFPRPWDSELFGLRIAQANLAEIAPSDAVARARDEHVECLYLFAPADDLSAINASVDVGGRLVDLRIEFVGTTPPTDLRGRTRSATRDDRDALVAMAYELAPESRFASDGRFGPDRVRALYEAWIDKSLEQGVIAVPTDDLAGFVAATPEDGRTRLELGYVAARLRGQGVGELLFRHAIGAIAPDVAGVTQVGNIATQRVFQKLNMHPVSATAVLHVWL